MKSRSYVAAAPEKAKIMARTRSNEGLRCYVFLPCCYWSTETFLHSPTHLAVLCSVQTQLHIRGPLASCEEHPFVHGHGDGCLRFGWRERILTDKSRSKSCESLKRSEYKEFCRMNGILASTLQYLCECVTCKDCTWILFFVTVSNRGIFCQILLAC